MSQFMGRFGFGQNTSIDIPQASAGTLPSRDWKMETRGQPWYPGETLNSAIGQGYTEATPLQLATATLVMANKGQWRQPVMLRQLGLDGDIIQHASEIPDVSLQNPDDWNFIHQAMQDVVHKGTGGFRNTGSAYYYIAREGNMPYHMAGKSGTAQVVGMAEGFDNNAEIEERFRDHALFIAFAPVENPQIALAVFVEHGEGGSSVAGPIAKELLDAYLLDEFGQVKPEFVSEAERQQLSSAQELMEAGRAAL